MSLKCTTGFLYYKAEKVVFKLGQVLESGQFLSQSEKGITKWCKFYYKVGQALQSGAIIMYQESNGEKWERAIGFSH